METSKMVLVMEAEHKEKDDDEGHDDKIISLVDL